MMIPTLSDLCIVYCIDDALFCHCASPSNFLSTILIQECK